MRYPQPGDRSSVQIGPNPALHVDFKLTALGGKTWEKLAEPQWHRFIAAYTTYPAYGERGPLRGELFSPDRDMLTAWMGWYPEVRREKILLDTLKWETHTDFAVLYWKRLPLVYRVTFEVENAEERWASYKVPQWFTDWWTYSLHWP